MQLPGVGVSIVGMTGTVRNGIVGGVGMPFTSPPIAALANIKEEMKDMIV